MTDVITRAVDVHERLLAADIDNAIGGALALGYHIDDPRGTQDIDVNVSLPASAARRALEALPEDIPWDESTLSAIEQTDQVRLMCPFEGQFPIALDLFFVVHELHETVRARTVSVPMGSGVVKILSATDLTIFKALFSRGKDWIDIEAMLDAHDSTVDLDDAVRWLTEIVGASDQRTLKLLSMGLRRNSRSATD